MNDYIKCFDSGIVRFAKSSLTPYESEMILNMGHTTRQYDKKIIVDIDVKKQTKLAMFNCIKVMFPALVSDPRFAEERKNIYTDIGALYKKYFDEFELNAYRTIPFYGKLLDYQRQTLFHCDKKQFNLISFEQGLGKSVTALALSILNDNKKTLIVAPAVVKSNWVDELMFWGIKEDEITFVDSYKTINAQRERFIVMNYELVKKYFGHLAARKIDHIIIDECHYIKNTDSGRHIDIHRLINFHKDARVSMLTGTPIKNNSLDMFAYCKYARMPLGLNKHNYVREYCMLKQNRYGTKITGSRNESRLRVFLSNFMIRVNKNDCEKLPDKIYNRMYYDLDDYKKEYDEEIRVYKEKVLSGGTKTELNLALHRLNIITSKAKLNGVKKLAKSIVDKGRKVVIFSCYKEPIASLKDYFGDKCVAIEGKTPTRKRGDLIRSFRRDSNVSVFIGQTVAAGIGINLYESSDVIICDFPLTASELEQAIDRLHRRGQESDVNIYFTICKKSIDEKLYRLIMEKMNISSTIVDGQKVDIDFSNLSLDLVKDIDLDVDVDVEEDDKSLLKLDLKTN